MKIAIIRLSALGDIIISASAISAIKTYFPHSEIHWYVDSRFAEILEKNQITDKIFSIPLKTKLKKMQLFSLCKIIFHFRKIKYDLIIDMQGLLKSSLLGKFLRGKTFIGFDKDSIKEPFASFFYQYGVKISYDSPILLRNITLIYEALKIQDTFDNFYTKTLSLRNYVFTPSEEKKQMFQQKLSLSLQQDQKYFLFILEASIPSKTYSAKNFIALGKLLENYPCKIFLLTHQNQTKAQEIFNAISVKSKVVLLPPLNLQEIKSLISSMDLVIGGDTGITHLAWALSRPSITLYGNTPIKRFQLQGEKNFSLSGNKHSSYDKNDFSINLISPESIYQIIKERL